RRQAEVGGEPARQRALAALEVVVGDVHPQPPTAVRLPEAPPGEGDVLEWFERLCPGGVVLIRAVPRRAGGVRSLRAGKGGGTGVRRAGPDRAALGRSGHPGSGGRRRVPAGEDLLAECGAADEGVLGRDGLSLSRRGRVGGGRGEGRLAEPDAVGEGTPLGG